ncbi:MAG TPA: GerMN domain-containing protein [Chloroflexia bacterium]|nr:GerMN domain-containing protein [Chloroflexia bacterium]
MLAKHHLINCLVAVVLMLALLPSTQGNAQTSVEVAEAFRDYYNGHQGLRVLGNPITGPVQIDGYPAQYFEKGRLEDHRHEATNPAWGFAYGRLTAEMITCGAYWQVQGTSFLYANIERANNPRLRNTPPTGFLGGTAATGRGIFVPYDSHLNPAPGYYVPQYFWDYINRADLFPGGWLHDVGLPMMDFDKATAYKETGPREITVQAFERAVLTYDPQNPPEWRVERANIGVDAVPQPRAAGIEVPAAGARVTLPLHILARVGQPCEKVTATLTWQDGTRLSQTFANRKGEDRRGLLIESIDWLTEGPPPQPRTQGATLEIRGKSGALLGRQQITVLSPDDPNTQRVKLYWVDPDKAADAVNVEDALVPVERVIPRTERVGTAALEELLWGPDPRVKAFAGFGTSIPLPDKVLSYPVHHPDWGPRVRLLKLEIKNGVAIPDFSREIGAYGGGSSQVRFIYGQIAATLKQFPSVKQVVVAVEGETEGVLQP